MTPQKLFLTVTAFMGAAALTASAQVNLWNINFAGNDGTGTSQNQVGEQPVPDGLVLQAGSLGGNQWNNVVAPQRGWPSPGNLEMTDANGGNAINFTWEEFGAEGHHGFTNNNGISEGLFVGYYGRGGFNTTLEMSGLDTDGLFDVYVYFTWGWNENAVDYSITAGTGDNLNITLNPDRATATYADMAEGSNYVVFSGISPDGTGAIHLNAQSTDGGFSAVQLSQVPEPSTYAAILGALALVGAFYARQRRRNV